MNGVAQREAYLGFGGNIGDVSHRIFAAWKSLERPPIITLAACSPLYRTDPMGGAPGQAEFVNAVCRVRTTLSARELLETCLDVERSFGRVRLQRWGPRTLDIDLLLYADETIEERGLCVPHARLRERLFVLVPLSNVAPDDLTLPPDGKTLRQALDEAMDASGETILDWQARAQELTRP